MDSHPFSRQCLHGLPVGRNLSTMQTLAVYLPQTIYLKFKIFYSDDYPFTQGPIWSLLECNDYLTSYNNISKYYKYLVDSHNVLNSSNSWSPAISIEKDILYFITKLNKFENLIYCL